MNIVIEAVFCIGSLSMATVTKALSHMKPTKAVHKETELLKKHASECTQHACDGGVV